jgi:hypothetical protein
MIDRPMRRRERDQASLHAKFSSKSPADTTERNEANENVEFLHTQMG